MIKKLCFDLDGVICNNTYGDYKKAKPIAEAIKHINMLYEQGNYIFIFTSRYMGLKNGDVEEAKKYGYKFTFNQLKEWNLKFHKLIFGKPEYDIIIDDKSIFFKSDWYKYIN